MAGEIDLSQFHEVFFEEVFEGIATMESGLLEMDSAQPNEETINNVFRAAHSIKGGAATFGFVDVASFTHVMETLFDELRNQEIQLTDELVQLLLDSVDFLNHLLLECQAGRTVSEDKRRSFTDRLTSYHADGQQIMQSTEVPDEEEAAAGSWNIQFRPKPGLFKSGNDPYRIIRSLSELGEIHTVLDASKLPVLTELSAEDCYLSWEISLKSQDVKEQDIRELFDWVEGEVDLNISRPDAQSEFEPKSPAPITEMSRPAELNQHQNVPEATSIRVNIDRVDMLVNLVGELVITQSMLSQFKQSTGAENISDLIRGIDQLEENTRELQEQIMRIRMLPIDNVFQRMPRLVRDLTKSLGKRCELIVNGKSTEVDKTVLEKISDPLTHLVRNCLDHGIETPEVRAQAGKSETGLVEISAYHEGGSIIIEVKDDGGGLNREAILKKAVEKGIVDPDTELSDLQIEHLIFSPGFSTAESVSDVSGRGVGMDVVKNNIEQLNGQIDVSSVAGVGTTFKIKLPLTLAIIEGQLVRVGEQVFIIPLLSILKSTQIHPDQHNIVGGEADMFRLEDEYIPIFPLKDFYKIDADYENVTDAILVIVDAVERFGILVDEVLGQQQVVVKSLETNYKQVPTISGATILGDGTIAMILDMSGLLRESRKSQAYVETLLGETQ